MRRKTQSMTQLKAKQLDAKFTKLVKFPHEVSQAKIEKLKLGIINPESTFKDPFSMVEGIQLKPQSARLNLNSSTKKHPYKPFPQKHLLSVFEYSLQDQKPSEKLDSETIMAQETAWIKSTKQMPGTQDYQYFFRNMPPANYFQTEVRCKLVEVQILLSLLYEKNQRKIICQVFDYLEDIMDNQRFSMRLKRILKDKEDQIENQKRFKRFKRRKQKEVNHKIKSSNENDMTLSKQYKLRDLWEILKDNLLKINKMSQTSIETEELTCEEFVQFLNDVGFENQNTLRTFFEEMKTMRIQRGTQRNSLDQNNFVLRIGLFIINFQKYMDNNEKIMYLHSQNAVYMRNVSLKNYLQHWHVKILKYINKFTENILFFNKQRSYTQIKQKLRLKRKQEQNAIIFLKELKENDEDEIVFELEDHLEERQKILDRPKNTYKEIEVHTEAVQMIKQELDNVHQQINQVYGNLFLS